MGKVVGSKGVKKKIGTKFNKGLIILVCGVIISILVGGNDSYGKSRSTPSSSEKMAGKASRYSLKDPRVVLEKIKEAKNIKEPKELPKGAPGIPLSPEEQEAINKIEDLKLAYTENKKRGDGYGLEIQEAIVETLGEIGTKRATKFLCALLESDKETIEIKEKIVEALKNIGDKKAEDALKKHLEYLKANKPDDPMAGWVWEQWIKKTEEALLAISGK